MKIYKCEHCGTIVEMIKKVGQPSCCNSPMTELVSGVSDGAHEKHVPVYQLSGSEVVVTIGEVEHPMVDAHYIEWIAIETNQGVQRKYLKPGDKPVMTFALSQDERLVAVYEYCNLHGLWKA